MATPWATRRKFSSLKPCQECFGLKTPSAHAIVSLHQSKVLSMNIDLRKIFFPLRSNAGWFQNIALRDELEYRLKQALFFYDQIIIEDGTYEGMIWENFSFDMFIPGTQSTHRTINLEKDIENTDAQIWIQPKGPNTESVQLVTGRTIARYKIDYFNILNQLDITQHDFIQLITIPNNGLSDEMQSLISNQTTADLELFTEMEENFFLKKLIFKNLNRDLVLSHALETAVIMDPINAGILEAKSKQSFQGMQIFPNKESAIVRTLLTLKVPNFNDLSLDQVVELRRDHLWQGFRENIARISNTISDNPDVLLDEDAFYESVRDAIDQALFEEIEKREQNGIELTADLILGGFSFVPVVGVAADILSAVRSLAEFQEHQNSWVAFLLKMSKFETQ